MLSSLVTACLLLWRSTTFMIDIGIQKQQYYEKYYLVEGLLNYGLALSKQHFNEIKKYTEFSMTNVIIEPNNWLPTSYAQKYKPQLIINPLEHLNAFKLESSLWEGPKRICGLECHLYRIRNEKKNEERFLVDKWQTMKI